MALPALQLSEVLSRQDIWRGDRLAVRDGAAESSGFDALDAELPGKGWSTGALTELLPTQTGVGELALLWPVLARLSRSGWLALVAPPYLPFAPAWAELSLEHLWWVRGVSAQEAAWATEQMLASGAFAAVLSWLPQVESAQMRRLQLAVEGRRSLAFVMRAPTAARSASPAPLRLQLAAAGAGALSVQILKRRGPPRPEPLLLAVPRPLRGMRLKAPHHAVAGPLFSTLRTGSFSV